MLPSLFQDETPGKFVGPNLPDPDRGVGSSENAERLLLQSLFLLLLTLYAVPAAR